MVWPTVTFAPLNIRSPPPDSWVMVMLSGLSLSTSLTLKLSQVRVMVESSRPVTAPPADTGAWSLSTMVVSTLDLFGSITRFSKLPPLTESIVILKFSDPSTNVSLMVLMSKATPLLLAGILTVTTPEKSTPLVAVPLYFRVTVTSV
ncbi:hypothetical protein D3C71_1807370 [compost metagenome]